MSRGTNLQMQMQVRGFIFGGVEEMFSSGDGLFCAGFVKVGSVWIVVVDC